MRWSYDIRRDGAHSYFHGDLLVTDDLVLVATDGHGVGYIYAFDQATGEVRWKYAAGEDLPSDVVRDGSTVFATSARDEIIALDLESGELQWTFNAQGDISEGSRLISSPAAAEGRVFFSGRDGVVYALDAVTCGLLWTLDLGTPALTSPAVFGGAVYLGTGAGQILRLDPVTGDVLSELRHPGPVFEEYRVEASEQGILAYVGRATPSAPSHIISLDPHLTSVRWERESRGWSTPRALDWNGSALAGEIDGGVYAIRPTDGEMERIVEIDSPARGVSGDGDWLFIGTLTGPLYAYRVDGGQEHPPQSAPFGLCQLEGYEGTARCGEVSVWEDPLSRTRRLSLRVAILPASGPDSLRRPDPVFVLDGGPGQAATRAAPWVAEDLAAVRETRDIILVDRRGTGASNPLDCPGEPGPDTPPHEIMRPLSAEWLTGCREHLETRADLTRYTTPYGVDDIVAVADSLRIGRFNLYGGSYGSREAFELVRRHPSRVRAVAVFAVTPQHKRAVLESPATAELSMQRLLDDCAADPACNAAFPRLGEELDEVVRRLDAEPAELRLPLPDGGESEPLTLTRTAFGSVLRTGLISPAQAVQLPALIHASYLGDFTLVASAYVRIAQLTPAALSRGLFLSAACAEEIARIRPDEVERAAEGTFWGEGWVRSLMAQCEIWPTGDLPSGFFDPPTGSTPTLLLSGWLDPIAPPAWAEELRRYMPNARLVLVRKGHHNFPYDPCARRVLADFFDRTDPFNLDVSCLTTAERPGFVILG